MKPLPPVPPQAKLPITYHVTIVKDPDGKQGWYSIVLTKMQGDQVLARRAQPPEEPNMDLALDALNKVAVRVYYFGEGEDYI